MIWFTCNKCGKRHSRPDTQSGVQVFCDCGTGIRVPWNSTAAPEILDAQPVSVPAPAPIPVPPVRPVPVPPRESDRAPRPQRLPTPPPRDDLPLPPRQANRLPRRVRAGLCFNHDDDASSATCSACRLPFCPNCLVLIGGEPLCGPCKNFKFAGLGRPVRPLPMSVLALLVSLVSAPVMLALTLLAAGLYRGEGLFAVAVALCLLALALPLTGLWLSLTAIKRLETQSHHTGRGMAAGGLCTALLGLLWAVVVGAIVLVQATGS